MSKYAFLSIILLVLEVGVGNGFAESDILGVIENKTEQIHGIVTNIKEITDVMQDPEQCTECEQSQKQSQNWQFNALAIGIGVIGSSSTILGILNYRKKFTGLGGLLAGINKITKDDNSISAALNDIRGLINTLHDQLDDQTNRQNIENIDKKITTLEQTIRELVTKIDEMNEKESSNRNVGAGRGRR